MLSPQWTSRNKIWPSERLELACGRRYVLHFWTKKLSFVSCFGGRLRTKILFFRVQQASVYVLNPIRLILLARIQRIMVLKFWFQSFQNWRFLLVYGLVRFAWGYTACMIYNSMQNKSHSISLIYFDLIWFNLNLFDFKMNKNQNKLNKWVSNSWGVP